MNPRTATRRLASCRACDRRIQPFLDLGIQHLSEFRPDPTVPPAYPLELAICLDEHCGLVQLTNTAPPDELYHSTYSFKSGISPAIAQNLGEVVDWTLDRARTAIGRPSWLDIACNDGTLLSKVPQTWLRYGIDPLRQFAKEAQQHGQIATDLFHPRHYHSGQFDVITSISMFYDIDLLHEFIEGVKHTLAPNGIWVIQQNHLAQMVTNRSVDNISHEHLTYFSLRALNRLLEQHRLRVVDAVRDPVNGGCIRTAVVHADADAPTQPTVQTEMLREDRELYPGWWSAFARNATHAVGDVREYVHQVNRDGKNIWIYGASTRGGTIWQAAGLTRDKTPYVVDRNPDKIGRYMSSIGVPIISEGQMRADPPDYLLVGPWWFRDQFIEREADYLRAGGHLVFPLPELDIVGAEAL